MRKNRRKKKLARSAICPCGGPKIYAKCCKPFHRGESLPEKAVELMKSRYSAYAQGEVDYIVETTDPAGEAFQEDRVEWEAAIADFGARFRFTGVDIFDAEQSDDEATVTFRANLKAGREDVSLVETSTFRRVDERWLYSSGTQK